MNPTCQEITESITHPSNAIQGSAYNIKSCFKHELGAGQAQIRQPRFATKTMDSATSCTVSQNLSTRLHQPQTGLRQLERAITSCFGFVFSTVLPDFTRPANPTPLQPPTQSLKVCPFLCWKPTFGGLVFENICCSIVVVTSKYTFCVIPKCPHPSPPNPPPKV